MKFPPPGDEAELMLRANSLCGKTLQFLANAVDIDLPASLKRSKGIIGELLELYMGTTASTLSEPDFLELRIELKSIPINKEGRPSESTFVCNTPMHFDSFPRWKESSVKKKLNRVLWVPVEADTELDLATRRIGNPLLWSPNGGIEQQLKSDWEEIIEAIYLGNIHDISSSIGEYLQIRPKGANSKSLINTTNDQGQMTKTLPRGFYLRTSFTNTIINPAA